MDTRTRLQFFEPSFVLKIVFILLGFSLIILGEIFFISFLSRYWGVYFTLAIVALCSFIGLFVGYREIVSRISLIKRDVAAGYYIERNFIQLAGAFLSTFIIIIPGFFTDFLGLLGFFPFIRSLYGKIIFLIFPDSKKQVYESMKLYD